MKPKYPGHPIQYIIELSEAAKGSSESFGLLGMLDCGSGFVEHWPIDINGVLLNRSIQRSETDADTEIALGEVLLKVP